MVGEGEILNSNVGRAVFAWKIDKAIYCNWLITSCSEPHLATGVISKGWIWTRAHPYPPKFIKTLVPFYEPSSSSFGMNSAHAHTHMLYSHNHNIDLRTSMNERTHFSHFILERVDVSEVCERWVETGTDCYGDQTSSLNHSTLCCLHEPT